MTKAIESLTAAEKIAMRAGIGVGEPNEANGFLQLDADGNATGSFQQLTGTDAEIEAIVLSAGQMAYTTDTGELRIGDGITAGGIFVGGGLRRTITGLFTANGAVSTLDGTRSHIKTLALTPGRFYEAIFSTSSTSSGTVAFLVPVAQQQVTFGPTYIGFKAHNTTFTALHTNGTSFTVASQAVVSGDEFYVSIQFKARSGQSPSGVLNSIVIEATTGWTGFGQLMVRRLPYIGF